MIVWAVRLMWTKSKIFRTAVEMFWSTSSLKNYLIAIPCYACAGKQSFWASSFCPNRWKREREEERGTLLSISYSPLIGPNEWLNIPFKILNHFTHLVNNRTNKIVVLVWTRHTSSLFFTFQWTLSLIMDKESVRTKRSTN